MQKTEEKTKVLFEKEQSRTWIEKGEGFSVEVKRWYNPPSKFSLESDIFDDEDNGPWRWNVYAYIFPKHPIFKEIESDSLFEIGEIAEYFHWGISYHDWKRNEDSITCKQLGSDYGHLHDRYRLVDNIDNTPCKRDAERLFKYLSDFVSPPPTNKEEM